MPIYEFNCPSCNVDYEQFHKFSDTPPQFTCPECSIKCDRRYSISVVRDFEPHFNNSTGQYVNSKRDFKNQLAQLSARDSEARGYTVNYQPIDPNDKKGQGVTEEGLDATYAQQLKTGQREKKTYG